jgi:hypothetical protein
MGMSDEYGRKINRALAAVRRLHGDVSKLLVDADGTIGKDLLPAIEVATVDQARGHRVDCWMAKGVFRMWKARPPADQTLRDVLMVRFFDAIFPIEEPILLLGQLKYRERVPSQVNRSWDLWSAYTVWSGEHQPPEKVRVGGPVKDVEWFTVIGVPLYRIGSMADVVKLMQRVRSAKEANREGQS